MKKKLQFLFSVVALLLVATVAKAQGFAEGKYYFQNVESGRYLGSGNSWGTEASLLKNPDYLTLIANTDGTYKIESQVSNGGKINFGEGYMDNGNPYALTFTAVGDYYTMAAGDNYFGWNGTSTVLGQNLASNSPNALWKIIPEADMIASLETATADKPVDATFLITDHTFGRNHRYVSAWTNEGGAALTGGNSNKHCAEKYHGVFNVYQKLTGAPAGVYKFTAQGFYRQDGSDNENLPVFYANSETSTFPVKTGSENSMADACTSFEKGLYAADAIYVQVTNAGELTVGVKLVTNTSLWCIWDNFELTYYGPDADLASLKFGGLVSQVTELREQATALKSNEAVSAGTVTALEAALEGSETIEATEDAYKAAIAALTKAVEQANLDIDNKAAIEAMYALMENTNVYTADAYTTYKALADDYLEKYNAGTLTETVVNPSAVTGWHTANNYDDLLLSAWSIGGEQCADFTKGLYINTWSVEGETDGTDFKVPFFEYFGDAANSLGATTLSATMEGLTPGLYQVTAWVRNQPKNNVVAADITGINLQVNDGDAVDATEGEVKGGFNIGEFSAAGIVGEDGKLVIKVNVTDQNNSHWLSFKNVKYTYRAPVYAVAVADGIENGTVKAEPTLAAEGDKVTLTIQPAAGYELDELSVKNGENDVEVAEDYTFTMPAGAVSVSASFKEPAVPPTTYAITIAEGIENGTVEADPAEAAEGTKVTLTIKADAGYELDVLSVKNGEDDVEVAEDYTFTMPAGAVSVSASFKERPLIKNADFSESTPLDNHLCGYGKDMATNGTTYYGLQDVEGWSKVVVSGDNATAGYPNSGMGGGVFAYGSNYEMRGGNITAPAAGPDGKEGQALGFFGVWSCGGYYYQDVTLSAGEYTLIVPIYNQKGTQANTTQTGFFVTGSDTKYTVAINTAVGKWTTQSVDFTLTEETAGQIRLGYVSTGGGSGANPMIYFDQVKLVSKLDGALELYDIALEDANKAAQSTIVTGEEMTTLNEVIAANANIDKTSLEAVEAATKALNDAVSAFNAIKPAYQQLADTKALVEIDAWPYASASKKAAVEEAMDATATSADDATAKATVLIKAYRQFVESNAIAEGVEGAVVMTDKITNPAATDGTNNWTTKLGEGSGGSIGVKVGTETKEEPWTDSEDNVTHNYFDGGNWGAQSWDVSLEQEITLEPGKYMLTAIARASGDVAFSLYAGETKVTIPTIGAAGGVFNRGWNDQFVKFEVEEAGAVKIGVQGVVNEAIHNWMSFSNFRLVQLEAPAPVPTTYAIAINDGIQNGTVEADFAEAEEGETVKLTITPAENYELKTITISYVEGEGDGAETKYIDMAADSTFQMPAADVTIGAEFAEIPPVDPNDYTAYIVNADLKGEGGFDATGTKGIDGSGIVKGASNAQFDFKQTITLPAGQYKLTAQAAYRYGTGDGAEQIEADAIAAGTETKLATLYATVGEDTETAAVQNRYNGASETDYANGSGSVIVNKMYVPNSSDAVKAWFAAGQYVNEVVFNVFEEGDVTIGIKKDAQPEAGDYTVIGPWTLTRLGDAEIPEIALNAPTFNVEEGTQAEPNMLPAGSTLKITYTADNLAENGVDADDVKVRMTVLVSGDLPENLMNMQSETKHSVMRETFYIPLGETDFPVALKEGYVYQNIVVMAAALVKQGETPATDEELAEYAGEPVQLHWVGLEAPATATYAITVADEIEGGEVEADVEEAAEGAKVTLTITPDEDYKLGTVTVSYVEGDSETKYVEVAADNTFIMPAAPVNVSATFIYVDPNLIEIAQSQSPQISDGATRATVVEGDGYTQYTTDGNVCVIVKMYDVDVTDCDYVVIKFAEPIPSGICAAFWAQGSLDNIGLDAGITEYKYVFANDTKCAIQNGILPQITLLTLWNAQTVKISGIYKHLAEEPDAIDAIETAEDVKADGKYMENGKLVIIKNGHKYNASGLRIK